MNKRTLWIGALVVVAIALLFGAARNTQLYQAYLEQLSSDPAGAGESRIYWNTTEKKAKVHNGTAFQAIGSGGAGEINYIGSPDSNTDWVDGGTGIADSTTTTAAELPREGLDTQALKLTNDGSGTAGQSYCLQIGDADKTKKLKIEWAQKVSTSTAYAAGDYTVAIYSDTASDCSGTEVALTLAGSSSIPAQDGVYFNEFDSTTSDYYELKIVRAAGSASSWVALSSIVVGPGKLHSGAVVTAWQSYTPTGSWTTNTTYPASYWRRVGENIEARGRVATAGAPDTAVLTINWLPSGVTFNTSKHSTNGSIPLGPAGIRDSGTRSYPAITVYASTTTISVTHAETTGSTNSDVEQDSPITFGASDSVNWFATAPITEWANSGVLNTITKDNLNQWTAVTVTGSWVANTTYTAYERMVGDSYEYQIKIDVTGTPTTASLTIDLPTGRTIDTSKLPGTATGNSLPYSNGTIRDSGAGTYVANISYSDTNTVAIFYEDDAAAGVAVSAVTQAAPVTFANGDDLFLFFKVPISELAGSQSSLVGFSQASSISQGLISRQSTRATPTFSASDFTANGSMTWTVGSGDVGAQEFAILGDQLFLNVYLESTTVGGTPSTELRIDIPSSYTAANEALVTSYYLDNGTRGLGFCFVTASATYVTCRKPDVSNWTASTNNTGVYFQITIPITNL